MSNLESLNSKLAELQAIPMEKVLVPNMPVVNYIQEAEDLENWSRKDLAQLAVAGITEAKLDDLKIRFEACREAQSWWRKEKQAELDWNVRSPQAFALRDEMLHCFRFAFRDSESNLSVVSQIAEGNGNDDMIQDLNDLAVLGKENVDSLTAINFDIQKLDQAAELSTEMGNLLAIANGSRQGGKDEKDLRDRAYTHLKELVDEIRACGKFVFWKNPKRLAGYASNYFRKQRSGSNQKATESEEETKA